MYALFRGIFAVVGFALVLGGPSNRCPSATTAEEARKSGSALADLAVNFYKNVSSTTQDKNAVMSPVSVALALALLESGASGATRDKIKRLLAGSDPNTDVLTSYRALQTQLNINDEKTKLSIANGVFPFKDLALKAEYEATVKDCFESEIEKLDYQNQLEQSRQKINKWVSDKTSSKIPELFKQGVLTRDVVLVLANAIYFKGGWKTSFSSANTKPGTFYRFGREQDTQTVQFMKQVALFGYTSDNDVETLEISYANNDLDLYILLPKTKDGLRAFEQQLTGEKLKSIIAHVQPRHIKLALPKFTIRSGIDLTDILTNLGLGVIFDSPEFGRVTDAPLKVSKAVHEAYINVNENGTEAAAATGLAIVPRSGGIRDPQQFIVDHPFLYAISHKPTGAIIFLGKVNYVEEKEN